MKKWGLNERKKRLIQLWVITGIKHCRREGQGKWIRVGVGKSISWNEIFPRCTAEVLTWSPGWGLIKETWSYPRRNRAQIASSLPWTGEGEVQQLATSGHQTLPQHNPTLILTLLHQQTFGLWSSKAESLQVLIPNKYYSSWFYWLVPSSLVEAVLISHLVIFWFTSD